MKNLTIVTIILLFCGCASNGPVFKEKVDKMEVTVPFEDFSITVSDIRENVSDKDIFLNPITFGGEQDSISPPAPGNLELSLVQ